MGATEHPEHQRQAHREAGAMAAQSMPMMSCPDGADVHTIDVALEGMGVGIFEWEATSGVFSFSQRCKSIWGFDVHQSITPEMMLPRVHPQDRPSADSMLAQARSGAVRRYAAEVRIVLPSGQIRWVQVAARTELAGDGKLHGFGSMRDNTERRLAEQKLRERSAQLSAFVEGAPAPIALLDTSLRYVAVSRRYAEDRGLAPKDLLGKTTQELFPNMPLRWKQRYQRALGGTALKGECEVLEWMRRRAGDWYRWELRPWYGTGDRVSGVIVFAEDLTPSVEERELRASQARLELALRAGKLGVFDFDYERREGTVDERLRRELELPPREMIIHYEDFLARVHPEDRERVNRSALDAAAAGGASYNEEYRLVSRTGRPMRWIAAIGRVFCGNGQCRLVGITKDITQRKHTELALKQSAAELRRVDERKNIYLATLSHELRSPLAPIRTAAHLLGSPKLTPEQLKWVSEVISRQTAHMASLLDDLLEITRISRGKLVLRKTQVPLEDIIQPALETVRPLIDAKGHHLVASLPEAPITVYADPLRMSQVLSNILTNAAKYTDQGGQIRLTAELEGESLVMRVKDNGMGIPREFLTKIFTMFWQGDSPLNQGGLGIGLAFAEAIVHLHHGTLEALSEGQGQGSEVIVRLPLKAPCGPDDKDS